MANIDRIVNVQISLNTTGISTEGFSTLLCVGPHMYGLTRVSTYTDPNQMIEDGFSADVDEEEGGLYLKMEPGYSKESKLLLDSLILGLQGIEEEYMDYLDVIFEEV